MKEKFCTVECALVFTMPFDEGGKKQAIADGREETEKGLASVIEDLLSYQEGVQVVTCVCDIVSPDNFFESEV